MPQFNEQTLFAVMAVGLAIVAIGYIWLVIRAFRTGFWWGVATVLLGPLGGLVFFLAHYGRAAAPIGAMLVGGLIAVTPIVYTTLVPPPKVAVTEDKGDEKHGTLTGASETNLVEYLKANRELAVLQMAGRTEVTDEVMAEYVRGMPNLRELDVNDTPVTDKGLEVLASLPKLETVRIARTKATPEGVQKHVLSLKGLKNVDVGGLNVPSKVLREWKNADAANRKYVN
jgi:hypothetical protein